jgi:hypothetical protein
MQLTFDSDAIIILYLMPRTAFQLNLNRYTNLPNPVTPPKQARSQDFKSTRALPGYAHAWLRACTKTHSTPSHTVALRSNYLKQFTVWSAIMLAIIRP